MVFGGGGGAQTGQVQQSVGGLDAGIGLGHPDLEGRRGAGGGLGGGLALGAGGGDGGGHRSAGEERRAQFDLGRAR